ncbi:hypothetical protein LY78DRAFT_294444 [Colletotrichum sublineola]|nr:hypothetical protein LY78DRAFT_294444 [Colletotrichum sublineola]
MSETTAAQALVFPSCMSIHLASLGCSSFFAFAVRDGVAHLSKLGETHLHKPILLIVCFGAACIPSAKCHTISQCLTLLKVRLINHCQRICRT